MTLPPFRQLLSELVAIPSISSSSEELDTSNLAVVELLATWLTDLGFTANIQPIQGHAGKFNLIASRGSGSGGLVFAGHTDTVPYDANGWSSNPFELIEKEDRFYGLGATDMKGFFPVILEVLRNLPLDNLKKPIYVVATADEESSMCGARALLQHDLLNADFAIIGEPTDLKPIRLHKGVLMESIRVAGQSGHSSDPDLGNNALEVMHQIITSLLEFRHSLQTKYQHPGFSLPVPTLNLGCIHGGDNPNRICGHCEMQFDLRPLPGMSIKELRSSIDSLLLPIAERCQVQITRSSLFEGIESFEQSADSPFVQTIETLANHPSGSVAFGTEAPFFQQLGMQTLILGPGSIRQAHQSNEFLPLNQLTPAFRLYRDIIFRCIG